MNNPGSHLSGTVSLSSTSTDVGGTGVASTTFEYSAAGSGGPWTPISSSSWNTKTGPDAVADGLYDLHVVAVDNAGNSAASTPITNVRIDNTAPSVTITSPLTNGGIANTVSLTATIVDADPSPAVVWEVAPHGTTSWQIVPASWNTKTGPDAVADGQYDIRATATDWAGNVTVATPVTNVTVDNHAPTVSVTAPVDGGYVNASDSNPYSVTANAADAGTGVQSVDFYECTDASCSSSPTHIGTDSTGSGGVYSSSWTLPADGSYWIEAVATDMVGHTSSSIAAVTVDRTAPDTTILTKPGDPTNLAHPSFTFSASEATQKIECNLDGAGWTTCTSPYSLAVTPIDGSHTMQIRAVDLAGNVDGSPASWTWHEDNTAPTATLTDPAAANAAHAIRGTVALSSTTGDPTTNGYASGVDPATVTYQYSANGVTWATIANPAAWDTTAVTDGIYQMQVLVTDFAGNTTTSATVANVKIDNTPPVTSQDDPGQYLRATINLTGTAADPLDPQNQPGSGVDHVDFQVSPAGANTWSTVGTSTGPAYSASFDTTTLTDGHYDFRTVAYDVAGNQSTSTLVTNRLVDNTPPVVQIVDPGANLRGTVLLATNPAGTNDPGPNASGIVSTSYEVSSDGGATWQPVGASWNTTGGPDGLYDIRATVTDAAGNVSAPSVVTARRVDNTPPSTTASGVPSGYSASDVTVTLTPTDGGSGVSDTLYSIDNGPTQHGTSVLIPAPSNGSNDGSHTISYQSVDVAGNVESPHSVVVLIDATPPACPSCSASDYLRGTVTVSATPTDSGAGIASVAFQYSPNGTVWTTIGTDSTGVSGTYSTSWDTTVPGDGAYHLRARITDNASNVSTIDLHPGGAGVVVVDNTAPTAAVGSPAGGSFVSGNSVTISASASDANPLTYAFLVNGSVVASGAAASTNWDTTSRRRRPGADPGARDRPGRQLDDLRAGDRERGQPRSDADREQPGRGRLRHADHLRDHRRRHGDGRLRVPPAGRLLVDVDRDGRPAVQRRLQHDEPHGRHVRAQRDRDRPGRPHRHEPDRHRRRRQHEAVRLPDAAAGRPDHRRPERGPRRERLRRRLRRRQRPVRVRPDRDEQLDADRHRQLRPVPDQLGCDRRADRQLRPAARHHRQRRQREDDRAGHRPRRLDRADRRPRRSGHGHLRHRPADGDDERPGCGLRHLPGQPDRREHVADDLGRQQLAVERQLRHDHGARRRLRHPRARRRRPRQPGHERPRGRPDRQHRAFDRLLRPERRRRDRDRELDRLRHERGRHPERRHARQRRDRRPDDHRHARLLRHRRPVGRPAHARRAR